MAAQIELPDIQMNKMALVIAAWREQKGFLTPPNIDTIQNRTLMMEKLMLIVTEIAEAAEAVRHVNHANFEEELADTIIRILDICGTGGINIDKAVSDKMRYNDTRPFLHGKKL